MKMTSRLLFVVSALTALGGCVAVPAQPGYYEPAPVVYVPAPVVYSPPVYRGGGGHGHRGGRGHGYR
jgi:hypothetical protein